MKRRGVIIIGPEIIHQYNPVRGNTYAHLIIATEHLISSGVSMHCWLVGRSAGCPPALGQLHRVGEQRPAGQPQRGTLRNLQSLFYARPQRGCRGQALLAVRGNLRQPRLQRLHRDHAHLKQTWTSRQVSGGGIGSHSLPRIQSAAAHIQNPGGQLAAALMVMQALPCRLHPSGNHPPAQTREGCRRHFRRAGARAPACAPPRRTGSSTPRPRCSGTPPPARCTAARPRESGPSATRAAPSLSGPAANKHNQTRRSNHVWQAASAMAIMCRPRAR